MNMKSNHFNLKRFVIILLVVSVLFGIGLYRIQIDTDIVNSLPKDVPAISDALDVFKNHPIQDQLVIDVGRQKVDLDRLIDNGDQVERRLKESGLFKSVGMEDAQHLIPDLIAFVVDNLPLMFSEKELNDSVGPLLGTEAVSRRFEELRLKLLNLEGIGQAATIEKDPLGLKDIVLSRMRSLMPSSNAHIYRGKLISADNKHLLVIAYPKFSSTDTQFSRRAVALIEQIAEALNQDLSEDDEGVTLTPVGAYRAALDNELIAKQDVKNAILFATVGIALLLIFAFPRPYIGLLALLPALAGSAVALFVFSLLHESISIMVLGFGGAIISITVDHGIAYLLFLDRPHKTYGKEASHEVWSIGLLAALTTIGAFSTLGISGFPVLEQLGQFAALGILLSFIFVHIGFPAIFPVMPPARSRVLPLQAVADKLALSGKKGAYMALGFALVMLFFVKLEFNVDFSRMNTVSQDTLDAENRVAGVWGHVFNKVYFMTTGKNVRELQEKGDRLIEKMALEQSSEKLSSGFIPSMIFPGETRRKQNLAAWGKFWNQSRIAVLRHEMERASREQGFRRDAFTPFYDRLARGSDQTGEVEIPEGFFKLVGITKSPDGSRWIQVSTFNTGRKYNAEEFYEKYHSLGKIFDPKLFSEKLGALLLSTFLKMLAIISISVAVLLFLFFLDLKLTLVTLLPVIFAFICTLGTLNLIGHPLDIPGLMLSIIVIGMGIDYSLFFVRSYQRYGDPSHPYFGLIRMAVLMASASTLIGFGVLCNARHTLLRSAGLTSLFGIGYALIGAFVILPPVLKYIFQKRANTVQKHKTPRDGVLWRFRNLEAYPRVFARFKMLLDPMFKELPSLVAPCQSVRTIFDIGCGFGVPACWLLERFPEATVYGIDPAPGRVRVASIAVGRRGSMAVGRAPDISGGPDSADMVTMLDILHYLDDDELRLTLQRLHGRLLGGGRLIMRATIPVEKNCSWVWWIENLKHKISKISCYYRSFPEIERISHQAGFKVEQTLPSGTNGDLVWFILKAEIHGKD